MDKMSRGQMREVEVIALADFREKLDQIRAEAEEARAEILAPMTEAQRAEVEALEDIGHRLTGYGRLGFPVAVLRDRFTRQEVTVGPGGYVQPELARAGLELVKDGARVHGAWSAENWALWRGRRPLTEADAEALVRYYGPGYYKGPGRAFRGQATVKLQGRRALVRWSSGRDI